MAAVSGLDLDGVDTVVLVAVVVVLVVVAAGFSEGFAVGPVVGSPAAELTLAGDLSVLSPSTSRPSVSPAGGVATSGSTAPSIYAQQGKCRNHAAFSTLKTIKQPL